MRDGSLERAVDLYNKGYSQARIGRRLGVHHTTIGAWLEKAGVERRNYTTTLEWRQGQMLLLHSLQAIRARLVKADMQQAAQLYVDKGMTPTQISAEMQRSGSYVYRLLQKAGVQLRVQPRTPQKHTSQKPRVKPQNRGLEHEDRVERMLRLAISGCK